MGLCGSTAQAPDPADAPMPPTSLQAQTPQTSMTAVDVNRCRFSGSVVDKGGEQVLSCDGVVKPGSDGSCALMFQLDGGRRGELALEFGKVVFGAADGGAKADGAAAAPAAGAAGAAAAGGADPSQVAVLLDEGEAKCAVKAVLSNDTRSQYKEHSSEALQLEVQRMGSLRVVEEFAMTLFPSEKRDDTAASVSVRGSLTWRVDDKAS